MRLKLDTAGNVRAFDGVPRAAMATEAEAGGEGADATLEEALACQRDALRLWRARDVLEPTSATIPRQPAGTSTSGSSSSSGPHQEGARPAALVATEMCLNRLELELGLRRKKRARGEIARALDLVSRWPGDVAGAQAHALRCSLQAHDCLLRGKSDAALRYLKEMAGAIARLSDGAGRGRTQGCFLNNLGVVCGALLEKECTAVAALDKACASLGGAREGGEEAAEDWALADARYNLGLLQLCRGDHAGALRHFRGAEVKWSHDPALWYRLAESAAGLLATPRRRRDGHCGASTTVADARGQCLDYALGCSERATELLRSIVRNSGIDAKDLPAAFFSVSGRGYAKAYTGYLEQAREGTTENSPCGDEARQLRELLPLPGYSSLYQAQAAIAAGELGGSEAILEAEALGAGRSGDDGDGGRKEEGSGADTLKHLFLREAAGVNLARIQLQRGKRDAAAASSRLAYAAFLQREKTCRQDSPTSSSSPPPPTSSPPSSASSASLAKAESDRPWSTVGLEPVAAPLAHTYCQLMAGDVGAALTTLNTHFTWCA